MTITKGPLRAGHGGQMLASPIEVTYMGYREPRFSVEKIKQFLREHGVQADVQVAGAINPGVNGLTMFTAPGKALVLLSTYVDNPKGPNWVLLHELGHVIDIERRARKRGVPETMIWELEDAPRYGAANMLRPSFMLGPQHYQRWLTEVYGRIPSEQFADRFADAHADVMLLD